MKRQRADGDESDRMTRYNPTGCVFGERKMPRPLASSCCALRTRHALGIRPNTYTRNHSLPLHVDYFHSVIVSLLIRDPIALFPTVSSLCVVVSTF